LGVDVGTTLNEYLIFLILIYYFHCLKYYLHQIIIFVQ